MKVKSDSWHYKWLRFARWDEWDMPKSLCTYFWSVVLLAPLKIGALVAVIVILVGGPLVTLVNWIYPFLSEKMAHVPLAILYVELICILIFCLIFIKEKLEEKLSKRKKTTLLGSYLSAKKQKICPLINYED